MRPDVEASGLTTKGTDVLPRPRRVFTAPTSLESIPRRSGSLPATSSRSEDLVETFYNHPSVKIVAFTSSQPTSLRTIPDNPGNVPPDTIPASSRLERTLAVGAFRIYRAPGSVAFLSCGSALQPILPKSQCWCIDEGSSRFVLQIRRPQYWRIELPTSEPDDAQRALLLRDVLDRVLLFEKTVCPFQRSFTVTLPDPPRTPVKKRAWTAAGKNLLSSPFHTDLSPPPTTPRGTNIHRRGTLSTEPSNLLSSEDCSNHIHHRQSYPRPGENLSLVPHDSLKPVLQENPGSRLSVAKVVEQTTISLEEVSKAPQVPSNIQRSHRDPISDNRHKASNANERIDTGGSPVKAPRTRSGPKSPDKDTGSCHVVSAIEPDYASKAEFKVIHTKPTPVEAQRTPDQSEEESQVCTRDTSPEVLELLDDERDPVINGFTNVPQKEATLKLEAHPTFEGAGHVAPVNLAKKRMTRMIAGRSFTAPPQLTLVTSPPSKSETGEITKSPPPPPDLPSGSGESSPVDSTDSFHSVQSWHSPITLLPASPSSTGPSGPSTATLPYSTEGGTVSQVSPLSEDTPEGRSGLAASDSAAVADQDKQDNRPMLIPVQIIDKSIDPSVATRNVNITQSAALAKRPSARQRARPTNLSISRRALSPLPSAANLFSPPAKQTTQGRLVAVRRLPSAIVHKTVEILLSPPSHLVHLMLKVAAKIAAGEWRGLVFGFGETGEQIPVLWDYSDSEFGSWSGDEDYTMASFTSSSEDAIPRSSNHTKQGTESIDDNSSWEVD